MAWAIRTEGDRVGGGTEYRNKLWRVTTYIEADGKCLKDMLVYVWAGDGRSQIILF